MTVLAFDGRMGAAGDMIVGALLDAGADRTRLELVEAELGLEYRVESHDRSGIAATGVTVVDADSGEPLEGGDDHRHHSDVVAIVEDLGLPNRVEAQALACFELLGRAEAAVHDTDLAATHFHEVGADDAIADIVGAALLVDDLDPERIVTTPLSTGGGSVSMSHGEYPVPTQAVLEIAERADWSLRGGPVEAELLTPTGAAILGHLAAGVPELPSLSVTATGTGAGRADHDPHPNVLRVLVGTSDRGLRREEIAVLETNLDDATPEVIGSLQETLLSAGALDVTVLPATMKKSRPGHLVKVICRPADRERLARRLARETGTLGVRETGHHHRFVTERTTEPVTIEIDGHEYSVPVKVATDRDGNFVDVSAEYDDALAVARDTGAPVRAVMAAAERRWQED